MSEEVRAEFITHLINGNNAMHRDELDLAVAEYSLALDHNPNFPLIYTKLGQANFKKKDFEKAISCFKKALELNPGHRETLYRLAMAYEATEQPVKAAVVYEMMDEEDQRKEGSATSPGNKNKSRRRSSSAKSLRSIKTSEVLPLSLRTFTTHPLLIVPVFIGIAASLLIAKAIMPFFYMIPGDNTEILSFFTYLLNGRQINAATVIYVVVNMLIATIICAPLFASVTILTRYIYRDKQTSFGTALTESFARISPLLSTAIIGAAVTALVVALGIFLFQLSTIVLYEIWGVSIRLRPLALLTAPLPAVYFIYAVPSIVIDKRDMESALKKSGRIGKRYFLKTACLLYFVVIVYSLIVFAFSKIGYAGSALPYLCIAPVITFTLIHITMVFTVGQEIKNIPRSETRGGSPVTDEKAGESVDLSAKRRK